MGLVGWLDPPPGSTVKARALESPRSGSIAVVDGATAAQIFWGVVLPLATPVLIVVALISFIFTFNEYVIASALLQTNGHFTMPVGMKGLISDQYGKAWGPFAAGALMAAIPVTALFLFLQKWIIGGLTAGSVKG